MELESTAVRAGAGCGIGRGAAVDFDLRSFEMCSTVRHSDEGASVKQKGSGAQLVLIDVMAPSSCVRSGSELFPSPSSADKTTR